MAFDRTVLHPISQHFPDSELKDLPQEARRALATIETAFGRSGRNKLDARISWVGQWWFVLIEGYGAMRTNVLSDPELVDRYALLAMSLGGRNRPIGALGNWPRPGEMSIMPWTTPSEIITVGEFRYLIAHIPTDTLNAAAQDCGPIRYGRRLSVHHGASAVLYASLRYLASEAGSPAAREGLSVMLPDLARLIVRIFDLPEYAVIEHDERRERIAQVKAYLDAYLADPTLVASTVASACGLSQRQFFRLFEGGESFNSTLRRLRLEKARDMLVLHPAFPIAKIARMVGFKSIAHFSRAFRAHVGRSPRDYRRQELLQLRSAPESEGVHGPVPG